MCDDITTTYFYMNHHIPNYYFFADIVLPQPNGRNPSEPLSNSILPAGERIHVIQTPKGIYIRTKEGKIFAVHRNPLQANNSQTISVPHNGGPSASSEAALPSDWRKNTGEMLPATGYLLFICLHSK
jgi:hypothetical protein